MEKEIKTHELEMIDKKIEELENELAKSRERMEQYKSSGAEEQYAYESSEYEKIVKQIGVFNELKKEFHQILLEMNLDYETEEEQINGILENMQKELKASGNRMNEYKRIGANEQYAYEFSEYSKLSKKINNYAAIKKEYDDITTKKEKINNKYDIENIDNKIEKLEGELKSSAIRMSEYKRVGNYEQFAYENSYYSQIVSEINELKGAKEEASTLDEKKAELIKELNIKEYHTEEEQINKKISELEKQLKRAGDKMQEFNNKGEEENYVYAHKEYQDITRKLNDITRSKEKYDEIKAKYNELLQPKKIEKKDTANKDYNDNSNPAPDPNNNGNPAPDQDPNNNDNPAPDQDPNNNGNPAPDQDPNNNGNPAPDQDTTKEPKYTITIGSSGRYTIDGKRFEISSKVYKIGATLNTLYHDKSLDNDKNKLSTIMNIIEEYSDENKNLIKDCFETKAPIDFTVINTLNYSSIDTSEKESLIKEYLNNMLKSHYEFSKTNNPELLEKLGKYKDLEYTQNMAIKYDMKDLSKPLPFLRTLLSLHPENKFLTGEEKETIAMLANKADRYGLGKPIGQYEYDDKLNLTKKILRFFKKDVKLLPAPEKMKTPDYTDTHTLKETMISEEELEAAYKYNDARNRAKANNRNIRVELQTEYAKLVRDKKINTSSKLKSLEYAQLQQENSRGTNKEGDEPGNQM